MCVCVYVVRTGYCSLTNRVIVVLLIAAIYASLGIDFGWFPDGKKSWVFSLIRISVRTPRVHRTEPRVQTDQMCIIAESTVEGSRGALERFRGLDATDGGTLQTDSSAAIIGGVRAKPARSRNRPETVLFPSKTLATRESTDRGVH